MSKKQKKSYDLKTDSISGLFVHYSLLSIAGLSAMSLNIMLDGIFIGHFVGSMGLASINLVLPLFPFLLAIGMCFGYGGAALVGIELGKGAPKAANRVFNQSFLGTALFGIAVTFLLEVFAGPVVTALGATELLREGVSVYFRTFSAFSVFFCLTLFFEPMVRNDGAPKRVMWSLILGAGTNAVLNTLFIVVLRWGLFGASFATGISQVVSCLYLAFHIYKKRGTLSYEKTPFSFSLTATIMKTGCPTLMTQICQAVFIIIYNWVILKYIGELGIAALGIIFYLNELVMLCNYGFGEALQPIASFNLGAACYDRMRKTFWTAARYAVILSCIITALIMLIPGIFVLLFTAEPELTAMTVHALRLYYAGLVIQCFNMMVIYYLEAVRKPLESTVLTLLRNLGWFIVMIRLLPHFFGETGIWLAVSAADLVSLFFVVFVILKNRFYFREACRFPKLYDPEKTRRKI